MSSAMLAVARSRTQPFIDANPNHYSVFTQAVCLNLFRRTGFRVERSADLTFTVPCGPDLYWAFLLRRPPG